MSSSPATSKRVRKAAKPLVLTYVYGLRLSRAQHRRLEAILEGERLLYNGALQERRDHWRSACAKAARRGRGRPDREFDADWFRPITGLDQFKALTQIRTDDPTGYGALPVKLSRWTLDRVDDAMRAFMKRAAAGKPAGFPRFKAKSRFRSFGFLEFSGIALDRERGRLTMKGMLGALHLHMHRPLPEAARILSCIFTRRGRAWEVALQCSVPVETAHPAPDALVGLDWGVESLATLSTGEAIANPRFGQVAQPAIEAAAQAVSKERRGSKRRRQAVQRLAKLKRRLANRRRTHRHQVAAALVRRFGVVAVEKLRIGNMTRSARGTVEAPGSNVSQKAGLNREILDTAPAAFVSALTYKAARAGGRVIQVEARNTSIECSGCGKAVPKVLVDRRHACPHCGLTLHRDHNAALVVRARARRILTAEAIEELAA